MKSHEIARKFRHENAMKYHDMSSKKIHGYSMENPWKHFMEIPHTNSHCFHTNFMVFSNKLYL